MDEGKRKGKYEGKGNRLNLACNSVTTLRIRQDTNSAVC